MSGESPDTRLRWALSLVDDLKTVLGEFDDELPTGATGARLNLSIARGAAVTAGNAIQRLETAL